MQTSDKKLVMAFGTFDFFHAGHENYLKQAKALGETLIVTVARDVTVKKSKDSTRLTTKKTRLKNVTNCQHVDKAVLGNPDDKYKVIKNTNRIFSHSDTISLYLPTISKNSSSKKNST